jgi:hypothetical protein
MTLFTVAEEIHPVGDPDCPACWEEYPDGSNPLLTTRCDRCGRSEEELAELR